MDETQIRELMNDMPKTVEELVEKLARPKGLRSIEELQAIALKISTELMNGLSLSEMSIVIKELSDFCLAQSIRHYIKTMDQIGKLKANQQLEKLNARHQSVM